jgi:hypothetical protein
MPWLLVATIARIAETPPLLALPFVQTYVPLPLDNFTLKPISLHFMGKPQGAASFARIEEFSILAKLRDL